MKQVWTDLKGERRRQVKAKEPREDPSGFLRWQHGIVEPGDPLFIDIQNPTRFDRTLTELESFVLCAMMVAGKNGAVQSIRHYHFMRMLAETYPQLSATGAERNRNEPTPFDGLRRVVEHLGEDWIWCRLYEARTGVYDRLTDKIVRIMDLDLSSPEDTCPEILDPIMGMKSSRFFLIHACEAWSNKVACLDTHVLKFMRDRLFVSGIKDGSPKTPSSRKEYERLEAIFVGLADDLKVPVAKLDLMVWRIYHNKIWPIPTVDDIHRAIQKEQDPATLCHG